MKSDGTVMLGRRITLKGWHLAPLYGQETLNVTKLYIEGFDYALLRQDASPVFPSTDSLHFAGCALLTPDNKPVSCDFMWADNEEFCLISMDGYFFICAENGDYQRILDLYLATMFIPE